MMPYLGELLSVWRNENPTISTGTFVASKERTEKWLDELVIDRDDRLLFMVTSLESEPYGHIGFSNFDYSELSGEIDSVLKGVKDAPKGIMNFASQTLIAWGQEVVRMKEITLSVYSDNESAIKFYEKLGFIKTHEVPLMKIFIEEKNEEKYEVAPEGYDGPVEKKYLYMKLDKEKEKKNELSYTL